MPPLSPRYRVALLAPAALLLVGCGQGLPGLPGRSSTQTPISDAAPSPPLQQGSTLIVDAVAKVGPAVVRIDTVKRMVNPLGGLFGRGPTIEQQQGQ